MIIDIDNKWKYKITNKELKFDKQKEINDNWQQFIKNKTNYWDGDILVVSNIDLNNKIIEISKTKYSSLVYAKETGNIKIYSLFSSILFKTLDNKYLVIKNNHDKFNLIGGMADINDFKDNYYSPYLCIKREIKEEIGLDLDNKKQIMEYKPSYLRIPYNENYCPTGIVFTGILNYTSKDFIEYMNNNSFDEEIKKCYFYSLDECLKLDLSDKDISYLKEILTNKEKNVNISYIYGGIMSKEYYTNLYKLYCYVHGVDYNEKNMQRDSEFLCWLKELYIQRENFKDYLGYLDLDIRPSLAVELGKGISDSFGPDNVTIVSRYGSTIPGQTSSSINFLSSTPYIVSKNGIECVDMDSLFLTHNPFMDAQDEIINLAKLHQNGSSICIGVYGSIYEKNKQERIESLRKLSGKIGDSMGFYSDSYNGEYYACIKSEFKTKKLERLR